MNPSFEDQLRIIDSTLNTPGEDTSYGCTENTIDIMKARCLEKFPDKPFRVVKSWTIWDLTHNDEVIATVLYVRNVLEDPTLKFAPGNWVKSTRLISLADDALFETPNTVYIMVGDGDRKRVAAELYFKIL